MPNAKAEGLPLASPTITLPRARPAILASDTALSAISAVLTALSAKCSLSILAAA